MKHRAARGIAWMTVLMCACGLTAVAGSAKAKPKVPKSAAPAAVQPSSSGPEGALQIDVTDVLGTDLHARIALRRAADGAGPEVILDVPKGRREASVPVGKYTVYTQVYESGCLILVDVRDLSVREGDTAYLPITLLEGTAGTRPLAAFDKDCDGAMDRVELSCGTNPDDAASVPGQTVVPFTDQELSKEGAWLRGELHAHSSYGEGQETVAQLVKRAERSGLDFLAIADRNTLAACQDPEFHSDKVVLIPAMEWGTDAMGVALVYGPRTVPESPDTPALAQTVSNRVQAQGGVFAVAHPCFSTSPWQWGVSYVNAIEIWCRGWRQVPPMWPEQLGEDLTEREDGKLVYSIATAAFTTRLSANGQAAVFWDKELARGLKACAIAGSGTSSPKVPMASPITYVYAYRKSVAGILDGLRRGRTFLSSGPNGPKIRFLADVLKDNRFDVNIGGVIPLQLETEFEVGVEDGQGKKLQVMRDGLPIMSAIIPSDHYIQRFVELPSRYSVYHVQVIGKAAEKGFGTVELLAVSSPIYAEDIMQQVLMAHPEVDPAKAWVDMARDPNEPSVIDEEWFTPNAVSATEQVPKWQE